MIKWIFFDLGGTLLDYQSMEEFIKMLLSEGTSKTTGLSRGLLEGFAEAVFHKRIDSRKSQVEFLLDDVLMDFLEKRGESRSDKVVSALVRKIYDHYTRELEPFSEARETLVVLKQMGLSLGLVSNTCFAPKYPLQDLKKFKMLEFFAFTLFSSDFGRRKNHVRIYRRAIELARIKDHHLLPKEIIFVGDQIDKDVVAPQQQGMIGVHINRGGKKERAVRQINDLREIIGIVKEHQI